MLDFFLKPGDNNTFVYCHWIQKVDFPILNYKNKNSTEVAVKTKKIRTNEES